MISAVPAYLILLDFGLGPVVATDMVFRSKNGKGRQTIAIFQSLLGFSAWISGFVFIVGGVGAVTLYLFSAIDRQQAGALVFLAAGTSLAIALAAFEAPLRAKDKYHYAVWIQNAVRAAEWLGGLVGLWAWNTMIAVASCMFVMRLVFSIMAILKIKPALGDYLRWPTSPNARFLRSYGRNAVAFMSFPVANALTIQGATVVIGAMMGPAFLAIFSVYRTVTRLFVQFSAVISKSIWPDITHRFAEGDIEGIVFVRSRAIKIIIAISAIFGVVSVWCGVRLVAWWTNGALSENQYLFISLALSAMVASVWQVSMVTLMAINRHSALAGVNVVCAILFVVALYWGYPAFGEASVWGAVVGYELAMMIYCGHQVRRELRSA
jgi:O-antigen/teichoic acid export membrane protein